MQRRWGVHWQMPTLRNRRNRQYQGYFAPVFRPQVAQHPLRGADRALAGAMQWTANSSGDINTTAGDVMRYEHVLVSAAAGLATVTMNRPERRNALSEAHMRELIAALGAAGDQPDTRAIILAANGPVFCSGHDFADMVERDLDGMRRSPWRGSPGAASQASLS